MQRLEVRGAVRLIYKSLGVQRLTKITLSSSIIMNQVTLLYERGPSRFAFSIFFLFSTVNTQHMQTPGVLVQLGYIWRNVSAVNRPSYSQHRMIYLHRCTVHFVESFNPLASELFFLILAHPVYKM